MSLKKFEFPKNKKGFEALEPQEQLLLEHLFGQRVIQATQELQNSALGMGFFKMPKNLDDKIIRECFRVLSYAKTSSAYSEIEKEYEKALVMAVDAQKITIFSFVISVLFLIGVLIWV